VSVLINKVPKQTCFVCGWGVNNKQIYKIEFISIDTTQSIFLCDKHLNVLGNEITRQALAGESNVQRKQDHHT